MVMNESISHLACLGVLCTALGLAVVGCATSSENDDADAPAKTIAIDTGYDRAAAELANAQGLERLDSEQYDLAQQSFEAAIREDKTFGPAHNNLGKVHYLAQRYYAAAHAFDAAIKLMPNRPAPHYNLGLTLSAAGRYDEAVDLFRKAVTLDPSNTAYQADLAHALVRRGEQSAELITLLQSVARNDERVDMRQWATQELGRLGIETP